MHKGVPAHLLHVFVPQSSDISRLEYFDRVQTSLRIALLLRAMSVVFRVYSLMLPIPTIADKFSSKLKSIYERPVLSIRRKSPPLLVSAKMFQRATSILIVSVLFAGLSSATCTDPSRQVELCCQNLAPYSSNAYVYQNICDITTTDQSILMATFCEPAPAGGCTVPSGGYDACCVSEASCQSGVDGPVGVNCTVHSKVNALAICETKVRAELNIKNANMHGTGMVIQERCESPPAIDIA
ncbi:hypothetical protein NM688_g5119 [Phlebia brevispora]|uniref:Uncharacterized protein n=1 Tax=Phlebia brevispora TaxID=194682 RepID=A0ACC1T046_9APHY|nr:hypothetical protein NM688_g5119 [Phlebia brevispora]